VLYKAIVTLDAPVQLLVKGVQYVWRHLCGRPDKAEKTLLAMRGLVHFTRRELRAFWRA